MELTFKTFLIVCPLVFLAGFVDAIGGGGGIISLPAYLFAGLPPHMAIGTNKMSSTCGTAVATVRLLLKNKVNRLLALFTVIAAIIGSSAGARLSLLLNEDVILYLMLIVLPICAFFVLNKKLFKDRPGENDARNAKTYIIAILSALIIGMYDGFYGPGTGTFLIIAFTVFAKMSLGAANAQAKIINLTTNITALTVFIINGQVLFLLGGAAALFNMAGNYLGAGLAIKKGSSIVRISIIAVLILLLIKVLFFRDM